MLAKACVSTKERSIVFGVPDSESNTRKARVWVAFVCPDCRFVFRVPKDHDGGGIICSSCRRMLRIPVDGERTSPLMASSTTPGFAAMQKTAPKNGSGNAKSYNQVLRKSRAAKEWKDLTNQDLENADARGNSVGLYILIGFLFLFSLGGVTLVWDPFDDEDVTETEVPLEMAKPDSEVVLEVDEEIELPAILKGGEMQFINDAKLLAKRFLSATHVDEILPVVDLSRDTEQKILDYYRNGKIEPVGMNKFNAGGKPSYLGNYAAVTVETSDFETRELAFVEGEDGEVKIDWESWVGWSEMPWKDLLITKPKTPVLVRVKVKEVEYYNFGFSDDEKWRSYSLISPDGENVLYGYVERGSLLDEKIRPRNDFKVVAQTLRVKFLEKNYSSSQVLIVEQVSDGWVVSPLPADQ